MSGSALAELMLPLAQADGVWQSPLTWALALMAVGVWGMFARRSLLLRTASQVLALVGLAFLAANLPLVGAWYSQLVYWLLALTVLASAAAAITCRSPLYTAIWFALSLLGTAGLFLFQGAQFLGVATVVVYAGAIVVTFLFVLMLAQPEGFASYDRISWSPWAAPTILGAMAVVMGLVLGGLAPVATVAETAAPAAAPPIAANAGHVAQFGSALFAKYLISIEVAGTLLLVALVGAVVIVIQGKGPRASVRRQAAEQDISAPATCDAIETPLAQRANP